jgi:Flp pilus assembly protein TadG
VRSKIRDIIKDKSGNVAIEFALLLPIMILLLLGTFEIANYVLCYNKVSRVNSSIADMSSRSSLTPNALTAIIATAPIIGKPFNYGTNGRVILTTVYKASSGTAAIIEQQIVGSGSISVTSKIGTAINNAATLPAGFTISAGDRILISETFFTYTPIFSNIVTLPINLYDQAIYRLRT